MSRFDDKILLKPPEGGCTHGPAPYIRPFLARSEDDVNKLAANIAPHLLARGGKNNGGGGGGGIQL